MNSLPQVQRTWASTYSGWISVFIDQSSVAGTLSDRRASAARRSARCSASSRLRRPRSPGRRGRRDGCSPAAQRGAGEAQRRVWRRRRAPARLRVQAASARRTAWATVERARDGAAARRCAPEPRSAAGRPPARARDGTCAARRSGRRSGCAADAPCVRSRASGRPCRVGVAASGSGRGRGRRPALQPADALAVLEDVRRRALPTPASLGVTQAPRPARRSAASQRCPGRALAGRSKRTASIGLRAADRPHLALPTATRSPTARERVARARRAPACGAGRGVAPRAGAAADRAPSAPAAMRATQTRAKAPRRGLRADQPAAARRVAAALR